MHDLQTVATDDVVWCVCQSDTCLLRKNRCMDRGPVWTRDSRGPTNVVLDASTDFGFRFFSVNRDS